MFYPKILPLVASLGVALGGSFAINAPHAFAEFTSTSAVKSNSATAGTISVSLVDAAGVIQTTPIVAITAAAPAMATRTSTIRIRNSGSLPAAVRVHTGNLASATANNLNSVLVAKVIDSTNAQLFTGSLSDLSVSLASVAAGQTVVLTLQITWPDLAAIDDNPFQDSVLTFEISADAASLVG